MLKVICSMTVLVVITVASGLPADASEFNHARKYVCATAKRTSIRDYPTFKTVAKLNWGECMDIFPIEVEIAPPPKNVVISKGDQETLTPVNIVTSNGEKYFMVRGRSGNIRLLPTRYSELR